MPTDIAFEHLLGFPRSMVRQGSSKSFGRLSVIRITFTGGTNVTLRGTSDPKWGWIDAHGQQASKRAAYATYNAVNFVLVVGRCSAN